MDDMTRRELVIRYVEATGQAGALCPVCRYGLAGLRAATCPECGTALTLTLGATESRFGYWIAGLLGWGVLGGWCLLMLLATAWMYMFLDPVNRSTEGGMAVDLGLPVLGFAAGAAGVWFLLNPRGRRWVQRLSRPRALAMAAASAAASPVFLALLILLTWLLR